MSFDLLASRMRRRKRASSVWPRSRCSVISVVAILAARYLAPKLGWVSHVSKRLSLGIQRIRRTWYLGRYMRDPGQDRLKSEHHGLVALVLHIDHSASLPCMQDKTWDREDAPCSAVQA